MRILPKMVWWALAGVWLALGYALAGVVALVPIITIPFSLASFRASRYVLSPFGHRVVERPTRGAVVGIGTFVWLLVAGVWLAVLHAVTALLLAVTVVGLPMAREDLRMARLALLPVGAEIAPSALPFAPRRSERVALDRAVRRPPAKGAGARRRAARAAALSRARSAPAARR